MSADVIAVRRPEEVAREVETLVGLGHHEFVVKCVARGGMLDLERLGAARYAAGLQARVELEPPEAAAAAR